ncbi:MAG: CdaR family protein [Anaerolineales bacterium]|nr:CdaR family protein [Anaerolineales bacterium]
MWHWLVTNFRTFLWALVMAVAVWISAVTAADPDEVRLFPASIPVEIVGQDTALVITGTYPEQISLTLRAPKSVWNRLTTEENSVRAVMDLSGLVAGQHAVDIMVQIVIRPVRIISVTPTSATIQLEPLVARSIPVDLTLSGQPAIGYQAGETSLDESTAVVAGPESIINKVVKVRASVILSGAREAIDQVYPLEVLDERNLPLLGVTITPENVHVTIPISQQGGYRDMAVKVVVRGQVASGYRLTGISVFPPIVTVFSSDPQLVNSLPGIVETAALDLNGASDDISTRLTLNLPAGISVVGEQAVLTQVSIAPIQSSLTLSGKKVEIIGLPAGLLAQVAPETVDVILSGPLPLLDTLSSQDVRVVLDLTGLSAGTHQLNPRVEILIADINIESMLPATVEVTLTQLGAPTITATP